MKLHLLLGSVFLASVAAADGEFYEPVDWSRRLEKTVVAPMDTPFPKTVAFGCTEIEPMVVTIAGTASAPIPNGRASVVVSANFTEGLHCWGGRTVLDFSGGGRQTGKLVFMPDRPIASGYVYYSAPKGVQLEPPKFEFFKATGEAILDGVPIKKATKFPKAGFLIRDAAAASGYAALADGETAKGLRLKAECDHSGGARSFKVRLENASDRDRAMTLVYAVPLPEGEIVWHDDPRYSRKLDRKSRCEANYCWGEGCGRNLHSRWPLGAVTVNGRGIAIGIDPERPAYYRITANPRLRLLFIAFDLGFAAPERDFAELGFSVFGFKADEGFRGALEKYRKIFPQTAESRVKKHGIWVAFEKLSRLQNPEDFHFRFNESLWEPAWDDRHDVLSLRYKEPCTWWMKIDGANGKMATYAECLAMAKAEVAKGTADARAWATSVFKDEWGLPAGMILDKPWCRGISWSMNASPGIRGELTEYTLKQSEAAYDRFYGATGFPEGPDGEYIDSTELSCTVAADFDRSHFAGMKTPLTFSPDRFLPCVFKGLSVWDYVNGLSTRIRKRGRVVFANATPNHWAYVTPQVDAVGIEVSWNLKGEWKPHSEKDLIYWRAVAGDRPYCFLMTNDKSFTREMTEKFFQTTLAYGLIPGFQSNYYFDGNGRHERDRDLFKKYLPLICKLSEAGWRPVNRLVECVTPNVRTEQFGERYFTLINHGKAAVGAEVRLLTGGEAIGREFVRRRKVEFKDGSALVQLNPGESALVELR